MKLKTIVYSVEPSAFDKESKETIMAALSKVKNAEIADIEIREFEPEDSVPTKVDSDGDVKMTWEYFEQRFSADAFREGFNVVAVHTDGRTHRKWGIKGIAGVYRADPDAKLEFYMSADKRQKSPRSKTSYLSQLVRVFLHEISHGFERWQYGTTLYGRFKDKDGKRLNLTHYYDYEVQRIDDVFDHYDMAEYRGDYGKVYKQTLLITLLRKLVRALLELRKRMTYPVAAEYWNKVTQPWYERSSTYKSGRHPGSDHATPIDTPVQAWADNFEVFKTFHNHKSMGNAAYCRFTDRNGKQWWARVLHLNAAPIKGKHKRGAVFGYTGNTGLSTGPHLHIDVWNVPIDPSKIYTVGGVRKYTVDPVAFFEKHVNNK